MAPNRKQIDLLLTTSVDLTLLQSTVQPKFLPLTHPKEEEQHLQRQRETTVQQQQPQEKSASYWDWPADVPKDLFSASHLESNLIKASEEVADIVSNKINSENDDYWAEESSASQQQIVATKPKHEVASYWDWRTTSEQEEQQATIDAIIEEDNARRFVSASLDNVQATAADVAANTDASNDGYWSWESPVTASHLNDASHPQANYWDWETTTESEKKKNMIAQFKAYEHARQLLTSEHIVELLQKQQPIESVLAAPEKSDEYWTWSESLGDVYWDESPVTKPSAVIACGGAGYWDM